jgi:hypothetical protein
MNHSGDVEFSFSQVGITWKSAHEDADTKQVTLKGTFENNGKTYEVTVSYNKATLTAKLPPEKLADINKKIESALNDIDTQTLSKLSGHTIRTNFDELEKKNIHVLTGNQEIADWKTSQVADAVTRIQTVFDNVFGLKPAVKEKDEDDDDLDSTKADDADDKEIDINFEETDGTEKSEKKTLEQILPAKLYKDLQPQFTKIDKLIDPYTETAGEASKKKDEFRQKLAENIIAEKEKAETKYYVKSNLGQMLELDPFLKDVEARLLADSSFILDIFIDSYLGKVVDSPDNKDTAFIDTARFRVTDEGNEILLDDLQFDKTVKKVIIPVNIANQHWIVYCFDCTDKNNPVLHKCDSLPNFTKHHAEHLENLETQLKDELHKQFKLAKEVSIKVQTEKVTRQENNNCGAHVCKNAESFMIHGTFPSMSQKAHEFTPVRLDMLFSFFSSEKND